MDSKAINPVQCTANGLNKKERAPRSGGSGGAGGHPPATNPLTLRRKPLEIILTVGPASHRSYSPGGINSISVMASPTESYRVWHQKDSTTRPNGSLGNLSCMCLREGSS